MPTKKKPGVPLRISRVMSEMGRKGGRKGGKRRLETMTPEERVASAKVAVKARWDKYRAAKKAAPSK